MDVVYSRQTRPVDHHPAGGVEEFAKDIESDAMHVEHRERSLSCCHWDEAPRFAARHDLRRLSQIRRIDVIATAFFRGSQLETAFGHGHYISRNLSGLAMSLQLKPIFEKRLHHGSPHHRPALRTLRFRID